MAYTEDEPLGPIPAGSVGGDDAVTDGFGRRFYREVQPDTWAVVDVAFYYGRRADEPGAADPYPVTLNCEMQCAVVEGASYDSGNEVYCDIRYIEVSEFDGVPTEDDARAACGAFDPAVLTWDGTWPVPDECWAVA